MALSERAVQQVSVFATVMRAESGTDWLPLREGGRYFAVSVRGDWQGRIALEVRKPGGDSASPETLELFRSNTEDLFVLEHDVDVRLWARAGEFCGGEARLELGT